METPKQIFRLEMFSFEIYSASLLRERKHWRKTTFDGDPLVSEVSGSIGSMVLPAGIGQHIDDDLSVIRPYSDIFDRVSNKNELNCDFTSIILFCATHGKQGTSTDQRRKTSTSRTVDFGVKPSVDQKYGSQYFQLKSNEDPNTDSMLL